MTNIATVLKKEIARVARKEVRAEVQALKKASAAHRTEIAALKRRVQTLEQEVRRLNKASAKSNAAPPQASEMATTPGFSAKRLAITRRRLDLTAAECGLLVGASALSIYKWEAGKVQPRAKFLASLASLNGMDKKVAEARLAALR